jgi:hypothetical protein
MTKVQEQCTTMVYSAAFWADECGGGSGEMTRWGRDQMSEVRGS